jgi:hypothetical protein
MGVEDNAGGFFNVLLLKTPHCRVLLVVDRKDGREAGDSLTYSANSALSGLAYGVNFGSTF